MVGTFNIIEDDSSHQLFSWATDPYDSMVSLWLEQFTYKSCNSMIALFLKGALFLRVPPGLSGNVGWVKIHIDDASEILDQFTNLFALCKQQVPKKINNELQDI